MGSTDPLTGARFPASQDAPDIATYIQNSVNDLSDLIGGIFATTSARDSAFTAWVAQGNTMRDGLICRVGGYEQIYRAGAWHGVGTVVYTASTVDTTVYTSSHTVMTVAVPDPLFPYKLEVSAAVLLQQVGAGVNLRGILQVNGTNINPAGTLYLNTTGATVTNGVLITPGGPGVSATLTGASTVTYLVNKEAGIAGNGFQASGSDSFWMMSAKVLPV